MRARTCACVQAGLHVHVHVGTMYAAKVLVLCCLASLAVTKPGEWTPTNWNLVGKPAPGHLIKLTFAIKQHNAQWLKDKLKAVSYPDSPEYTNYMNFDEIAEHVYGKPESVQAVTETLQLIGAEKMDFTLGRDFVIAYAPFEAVEKLFQANFLEFEHKEIPGQRIVSSLYYTIPPTLKRHVDFVSGLVLFPAYPTKPVEKRPMQKSQSVSVTPDSIADQYNTSKYVASNLSNSQAIAAFLKQYYDPTDLKKFQEHFNIPVKPIAKIVGENVPDDPGAEANLDVQYISATGRNVSTWFVSISTYSNGKQEDFLSWMIGQVNTTDSPWVHSASYGDDESSIDLDYANRVDNEFMKFGISGRTVLFASGDSGTECHFFKFTPNWPTSSSYVTAVGGTVSLTEVWSSGGGGFSNIFPTPDYQKEAVQAYLNSGKAPSESHFNKSGRAYPDVSAFSTGFIIIDDGIPVPVDGTSCATPTFAGIVAILNDVRLNKGLKTLGFLNPLLYTKLKGQGFFDVTKGSNSGGSIFCGGFKAIEGWDPASGWGNPNFGIMKDLVLN